MNKKISVCRASDLLNRGLPLEQIISDFTRINRAVWGEITDPKYIWTEEMLQSQIRVCPDLLYCAFEGEKMVATASGFFTTEEYMREHKTWLEKTGNGSFSHHNSKGNIAFGADLSVVREASPQVSHRLMLTLLVCAIIGNGIRSLYLGSRIPGYHKHSHMRVEDYVFGRRKSGKPIDPEIYFYLKDGFEILEIIPEYMDDPESLNYGVLIKWDNPLYRLTKTLPFIKLLIRVVGKTLCLQIPRHVFTDEALR